MIDFEEDVLYGVTVNADEFASKRKDESDEEVDQEVTLADICQQFNYEENVDLEDHGSTPRVELQPKVGKIMNHIGNFEISIVFPHIVASRFYIRKI